MKDRFERNIDYMRLSITDRCNLRCKYCMPNGIRKVPMEDILTFEEILEIAQAAAWLGITRFKVTGGEPLVRRGAVDFTGRLKRIPGVSDVTLTTNGILLADSIKALSQAGLSAVNISLDTLNRERFIDITGKDGLTDVLHGIDAAVEHGLKVKVNTVLQRGKNDDEWEDIIRLSENRPIDVRFIELMPIGEAKDLKGADNTRLKDRICQKYHGVEEDDTVHGNGPAKYVKIPGFLGSIGFISALHGKFCSSCNRLRLTSTGELKPCLCFSDAVDLRMILRQAGAAEDKGALLKAGIMRAVDMKPQGHCFDSPQQITEKNRMSKIGG